MENLTGIKGRHVIADFWGCDVRRLSDRRLLTTAVKRASEKIGATLLEIHCVEFPVEGLSIFAVLAESHISLHTYPEQGFMAADIFTCGICDPLPGLACLQTAVLPKQSIVQEVVRGDRAQLKKKGTPSAR